MLVLTSADRSTALYPDALNLLGLALTMIGRPREGLAAFDRALAGNPRYIEAHLNRAVVLQQRHALAQLTPCLTEVDAPAFALELGFLVG